MIGLPGSDAKCEIETARKIVEMGCDGARIYPTVVFYDTELADMAHRGEYVPLELDDAVARSAGALNEFIHSGVDCIRIGLCASDNLSDETCVMGGANHPAMGELVLGELYFSKMCEQIENMAQGKKYKIADFDIPRGDTSKLLGQRGKNRERIKNLFGIEKLKITEKDIETIRLTRLY